MGKALKIIGICLGVLLALLAVLLLVMPHLIPWGSLLSGAVSSQLGRPASVQEVSLRLWGGLELEVKGLVVQELPRWGRRPMLRLGRLHLRADLLPLLARKLVVRQVLLQGLEVSLVQDKDGVRNWQDLPLPSKGQASSGAEEPDGLPGGALLLARAQAEGCKLYLYNLATGQSAELPLRKLELTSDLDMGGASGRITLEMPGLSLRAQARSQGLGQGLRLEQAKLELTLDLAPLVERLAVLQPGLRGAGQVRGQMTAAGPLSGLQITAQAQAQDVLLSAGAGPVYGLPAARLQADLTLDLPGKLAQVRVLELVSAAAGLRCRLSGRLGWEESLGRSDAHFQQEADLAKLIPVLSPLLPWSLQAQGAASQETRLKGAGPGAVEIAGQTRVLGAVLRFPWLREAHREPDFRTDYRLLLDDGGGRLEILRLAVASSVARLGFSGRVRWRGGETQAKLRLQGEFLDLNRLPLGLPPSPAPPAAKTSSRPSPPPAVGPAKLAPPAVAPDSAAPLRRALKGKTVEAKIQLGRVLLASYELQNLRTTLEVKNQKIVLKDFACGLLKGRVELAGSLDAAPNPAASRLRLKGRGLQVTPQVFRVLQRDFPLFALPLSSLEGSFDLSSDLAARGLRREYLLNSLQGKGGLRAPRGVTIGLEFLDQMPGGNLLWGLVRERIPRQFSKFEGQYTLGGGRVKYDLALQSQDRQLNAQIVGSTGLLDETVQAQLKISGPILGRDLRRLLGPDGTVPIGLGGTLRHPQPRLESPAGGGSPMENLLRGILQR
ncbi:MAG: AsmA family protein [Desulfarculus sp.]|nr:MAG: AsmA family protein [Desulfarculus sp.]